MNTTYTLSWPCADAAFPDSATGCVWEEMHHLDDKGRHWCPTGYMLCNTHFGIGAIDGSGACQLWGERKEAAP